MSTRLEKLFFTVDLIDRATGKAGKVMATIDQINQRTQAGMMNVATGAAGLFATGRALNSLLAPSKEMRRALGEVDSLNVAEESLAHLEKRAIQFSMRYGESAVDIVRSSYAIQSAVQGIQGNELGDIAYHAALLAKGTKGSFEDISSYIGQTFNIYQSHVDELGRGKFAEMIVGKTAAAIRLFNADGGKMVEALKNLGSQAQVSNVSLEEQLAVMGFLQNTMVEGSRAGTSYAAFLQNINKAERTLGLTLTNDRGQVLPVVDVINRITGSLGDLSDAGSQELIQKAFGKRGASAVLALAGNVDQLSGNIAELKAVSSASAAAEMAAKIADPWERAKYVIEGVSIVFGEKLQPAIDDILAVVTDAGLAVHRWMDLFPNLTRFVGKATLVIFGLVAAVSLLALIGGVAKLSLIGLSLIFTLIKTPIYLAIAAKASWIFITGVLGKTAKIARALMFGLRMQFVLIKGAVMASTAVTWLANAASIAWNATVGISKALMAGFAARFAAVRGAMMASTAATWLFNAALWANPITWIIAAVIALVAAIALAIYYWDDITAAVNNFTTHAVGWLMDGWKNLKALFLENEWMQLVFAPLWLGINAIDWVIENFHKIPQWWSQFKQWFASLNPFQMLGDALDWIMEKIDMIPGIDLEVTPKVNDVEQIKAVQAANVPFQFTPAVAANDVDYADRERQAVAQAVPSLGVGRERQVAAGGLMQQFQNSTSDNRKTNHVEKIEIHTNQKVDGNYLADELALAAG